jgi:hypothetical protein
VKRGIREQIANHTTNTMEGEDIESIVNLDEELEFGAVIAGTRADHTEDDSGPRWDVAGSRGNSNEPSNRTRAPANGTPLTLETVID